MVDSIVQKIREHFIQSTNRFSEKGVGLPDLLLYEYSVFNYNYKKIQKILESDNIHLRESRLYDSDIYKEKQRKEELRKEEYRKLKPIRKYNKELIQAFCNYFKDRGIVITLTRTPELQRNNKDKCTEVVKIFEELGIYEDIESELLLSRLKED